MIASNIIACLLDFKNTHVHITEAVQDERGMGGGGEKKTETGALFEKLVASPPPPAK